MQVATAQGLCLLHGVAHGLQLVAGDGVVYLYIYGTLVQDVALLGQHLARTIETSGEDADTQLLGNVEGSLMETA